jgi:hypothetical protein
MKMKIAPVTRRRATNAVLRMAVALAPLMGVITIMSDGGHWR